MLGLDLRGRHRARLSGPPDARRCPRSTPRTSTARSRSSASASTRSASPSPRSRASAQDQIQVGLPNVSNAERATEQIGTTAQLSLYDFEPNVIPPNPDIANPEERPYNRLIDAVEAASKQPEVSDRAVQGAGLHGQRRHLLPVRRRTRCSRSASPRRSQEDLFANFPGERPAGRHQGDRGAAGDDRGRGRARRRPRDRGRRRVRARRRSSSSSTTSRASPATRSPTRSRAPTSSTSRRSTSTSPTRAARRSPRSPPQIAQRGADDCFSATGHALRRDLLRRRRAVLRLVRDRPRRRAGLEADHQLRRQPDRDRRPHRRPDLRGHRPGGRRTWPRC